MNTGYTEYTGRISSTCGNHMSTVRLLEAVVVVVMVVVMFVVVVVLVVVAVVLVVLIIIKYSMKIS